MSKSEKKKHLKHGLIISLYMFGPPGRHAKMKDLNDKTEENTNDNYCISDKKFFIFTG